MAVFRGEIQVAEGEWGDVEVRITDVEGDMRDLPFNGDRVVFVREEEWEAAKESKDG